MKLAVSAASGRLGAAIINEAIRNSALKIYSDYPSVIGKEHISANEYINCDKLNH